MYIRAYMGTQQAKKPDLEEDAEEVMVFQPLHPSVADEAMAVVGIVAWRLLGGVAVT